MTMKPNKTYVHGPYAVMGTTITCEVCGHQHRSSKCVVCEQTGDNGNWVDHIIEEQEKKEKDDKSSK